MRRSWRCMAALLLMIMILVSGGCQNIRHLSVSQSEKDDADTGTGYNIYYINNDETKIKAFAYQLSSTTEDGIISECMEALAVSPDDKNYKKKQIKNDGTYKERDINKVGKTERRDIFRDTLERKKV